MYCIFVLLEANIVDRTQQMEQISLMNVNSLAVYVSVVSSFQPFDTHGPLGKF